MSLEERQSREWPFAMGVNGLGGSSNDQVVLKWFSAFSHDLFYCVRTYGKNTGPHTTSTGPQAYLHKLDTCFLFIAPSLAAGREAGRYPLKDSSWCSCLWYMYVRFCSRAHRSGPPELAHTGQFPVPCCPWSPHTCISAGGPTWHLCLLTTCTCMGHGPGLVA